MQIFLTDDISSADPGCEQEICSSLRKELEQTPSVVAVQYLNREDAVKDATERVFKDQPELAALVSPDSFPASFKVKLSDPERFGVINDTFGSRPGVESVLNQRELVDRLFSVLGGVRNAAFAIAIVQAIAAILLIANMVQIAAFTRRTEVNIMRLVGATRVVHPASVPPRSRRGGLDRCGARHCRTVHGEERLHRRGPVRRLRSKHRGADIQQ